MIDFEIKSKTQPIGTRKGQTVYFAQPKSQQYFTNKITRCSLSALCAKPPCPRAT